MKAKLLGVALLLAVCGNANAIRPKQCLPLELPAPTPQNLAVYCQFDCRKTPHPLTVKAMTDHGITLRLARAKLRWQWKMAKAFCRQRGLGAANSN